MRTDKIKDFVLLTIGVLLVAISVVYFFEPNNITAGGITGLAIVINNYLPSIPIGVLMLIMDAILYVVAFLIWREEYICKYSIINIYIYIGKVCTF